MVSVTQDTLTPVGIGVIGAGLMGSQHAMSAAASPDVRLVAVTGTDADQASALAQRHGVEHLATVEAMLADDRIEAVVVATPTDTHLPVARLALAAGKHAFVEKPVTRTVDDAVTLRDLADAAGLQVGVGHVIRYFPEYRRMADAVRAGELGTPAVATFGRRCQQPDWAPDHWHTSMERSGGVAVDMLIHDVDLVRWYFGEPETVYARVVGSDQHGGLDYALATLTLPGDGPICHLHGSWAEPDGFSQSAEICGSAGMLSYDSRGRDELRISQHAGADGITALPPPPPGPDDPFQRQLGDFARAVRTGEPMPGDIRWAIGSLRIAEAMLVSSEQRRPVHLTTTEAGR